MCCKISRERPSAPGSSAYAEGAQFLTEAMGYVSGAHAEALTEQLLDLRAQNRRRPALQDEFTKAGLPE